MQPCRRNPQRKRVRSGALRRALERFGVGGLLAIPDPARAENGLHPRTPTLWDAPGLCGSIDPACMIVVDRSVEPVLHLPYAIPLEDTQLTADEVEDSRRHQFLAACRDPGVANVNLPRWLSQADLDAADAQGSLSGAYGPLDVLPTSAWDGCLHRITPDDGRKPIVCAEAEAGVDWDTSAVPAGTYALLGYTWEPEFNAYWPRPGVVKVVDGPTAEDAPPAVAIATHLQDISRNDMLWIEVCVSAMPGSTIVGSWVLEIAGQEETSTAFTAACVAESGTMALEFDPPEQLAGLSPIIRVDVTDPMGRSYTTYSTNLFTVVNQTNLDACPMNGDGGFIPDPECHHPPPPGIPNCPALGTGGPETAGTAETVGTAGTAGGSGETGFTDGPGQTDLPPSCACVAPSGPGTRWWGLAVPLVFRRRGRYSG